MRRRIYAVVPGRAVLLFVFGLTGVGLMLAGPNQASMTTPEYASASDHGYNMLAVPEDPAARHGLEMALTTLERLQDRDTESVRDWLVAAGHHQPIELVVKAGHHAAYGFSPPADLAQAPVLGEIMGWLTRSGDGSRMESRITPSGYELVEDHHTGTYRNVVLWIPQGYVWFQWDHQGQLVKIWADDQVLWFD